ncbi:MAG: AmmeMemoRadiSam system protein B, partial [Armatimonadetes bacterium]|nr:AmmeMemoRadiSam system protein B [Armatimonadota bacterium]
KWHQLTGEHLPIDFVTRFVDELTGHLVLDGEPYRAALAQAMADYRAHGTRPMTHAPDGYPDDPRQCAQLLDMLLARGRAESRTLLEGPVVGLMAPHIDLGRGGVVYGAAYDALRATEADLFIVLGTAHSSTCWPEEPPLATFTRLDYDTPFGPVTTDQAFIDAVASHYAEAGGDADDLFRDELVHGQEHSVEFQMLFLRHVLGDRPFTAVPILMGSLHDYFEHPDELDGDDGLGPILDALYGAVTARGGQVCIIAGADWAHVGPRFGADQPVSEEQLQAIAEGDEAPLLAWLQGDLDGFFEAFACNDNAQNVCSVAGLYALRALLPEAKAELLRYEQAFDPEQTVTFAAALLR